METVLLSAGSNNIAACTTDSVGFHSEISDVIEVVLDERPPIVTFNALPQSTDKAELTVHAAITDNTLFSPSVINLILNGESVPVSAQDTIASTSLMAYDFNQAYFDRLRTRVAAAQKRGIYVSVMLFEGWSVERKGQVGNPWQGHPFNRANNINGIDGDLNNDGDGKEIHTLSVPQEITNLQKSYVRKVIDTLNDFNNVLWEIGNEHHPESVEWQCHIIEFIHEYEKGKPKQHPVGMTGAPIENGVLFNSPADWISPTGRGGYKVDPPAADGSKVIIADVDHIWPREFQKWVWKSFTRGFNTAFMDLYGATKIEDKEIKELRWVGDRIGETETVRKNMGYTLKFADKMNLAGMIPKNELSSTRYCLANPDCEYLVYQPESDPFTLNLEGFPSAIEQAFQRLQPVTIRIGRGVDGRVAFNRRFIMRDGSVQTHPGNCNPNVLQAEGPVDPEVGVMTLTAENGKDVAVFLHHTCHPCHGYPHRYVISDWPGIWAEMMQPYASETCVPFVVNGCCGNIHHNNHLDPHHENNHHRMAQMLSETASGVLKRLETQKSAAFAAEQTVLRLPLRTLALSVVDAACKLVNEHPAPKWLNTEKTRVDWDWMYAVATLDLKNTQEHAPYCDYEIQAFRLGDTALVALMGEPFVEAQLKIKLESPAPYTFVAHLCNGYVGYIPTAAPFKRGGYETRTANWSKLQPEAMDTIVNAALELLKKLF